MKRLASLTVLCSLSFQAGCFSTRPVPTPVEPTDTRTIRRIGEAPQIEVTTIAGKTFLLRDPELVNDTLYGTQYTRVDQSRAAVTVSVPLDSIAELHTRHLSPVGSLLGVAGVLGGIYLIVLLTKDSCPLVYAVSDTGPVLEGELYSGAIARGLERSDLLRLLSLTAEDGRYTLRLSNEARETQYTDQLTLLAIDHAPGLEVLPGTDGTLHTVGRAVPPLSAVDGLGHTATDLVRVRGDNGFWLPEPFDRDLDDPDHLRDGLTLRFPVEKGATEAKLVMRIRNTGWTDHIAGRFLGLMGDFQEVFYDGAAAHAGSAGEGLGAFLRDQGMTLEATVLDGGAWREVGYFHPTGPVDWQDEVLIVPVDPAVDTLTIRLRGGALFWSIDYAAVDYSPDQPARVHVLDPLRAVDSGGREVATQLTEADDVYQVLSDRGEFVTVTYQAPRMAAGLERSLVLQSQGYYVIHQKQESAPDLGTLAEIRARPDGFLRYSLEQFWRATGHPAVATVDPVAGRTP